jgi:hypothetical protein
MGRMMAVWAGVWSPAISLLLGRFNTLIGVWVPRHRMGGDQASDQPELNAAFENPPTGCLVAWGA